jgi:hypothetical protein
MTVHGAEPPVLLGAAKRRVLPIAVICPTQRSETASTYFFGCSLTRVTSWVGLTKRSAMSSQISVVTI